MSLNARKLREDRKARIAARRVRADGNDPIPDEEAPVEQPALSEDDGDEMLPEMDDDGIAGDVDADDLDAEPMLDEDEGEGLEPDGDELPFADEAAGDGEEMGDDEMLPVEEPQEASAAFRYNPVCQKPRNLGSDKPSGGYHYYGPPPDAGTSYGFYVDSANDVGIIAPVAKGKSVFSPVSGKVMKLQGRLNTNALATVLAMATEMTKVCIGKETRVTSAALTRASGPLFDVITGRQIKVHAEDLDMPPMADAEGEDDILPDDDEMLPEAESDFVPVAPVPEDGPLDQGMGMDTGMDMLAAEGEDEILPDDEMLPEAESDFIPTAPVPEDGPLDQGMASGEGDDIDEELPPPSLDEVESVNYQPLASVNHFNGETLTEADVHMTLFGEDAGSAPYWNIDIKGTPVARVLLSDQPKPDEIRAVFCSADYYKGVSGAIAKVGLKPVLKQIKARVWANRVEKTRLAKDIRAKVEAAAQARVVATTKNLMRSLLNCTAIVCAGMDKNFYKEAGNPLKEALWSELYSFGITNPAPIIEAAFKKGSTKYFETVLSKAVEYMELEPKAMEQIKMAIGDADVLPPDDSNVGDELPEAIPAPEEAPTLSQRLAANSVAVAGMPAMVGNAFGDHKNALRRELRLGGTGPRRR
jgi:hypothetical protein